MKIVRIIARLNVGGPARHVAWLAEGQRRAGHETVLVAGVVPPGEEDMTYFAEALGVGVTRLAEMSREISPKDAVTVWKLYRLLRRERPDVVHTHTAKAGTVGRVAGFLYKWLTPAALVGRPRRVRFVHTYHGHVFHSYYGRSKTRLFLWIERALARVITDRVVVISPQQYREIHETFRVGRARQFSVVPLGLDTTVFADSDLRRAPSRAALGVEDDSTLLVGIVGRLTEVKNHRLFLEAAALYKKHYGARDAQEGRRARFVVVGDGHLRLDLETHACALGLTDADVTFTGTRHDPENVYAALDVVALTSLNEGTPLTLLEAMASARPVIATAVGGVVDLLGGVSPSALRRHHAWHICERGVQVEPRDAEAFAEGLAYLVEHESLRAQMGARGRAFVESNYSVARLVSDVNALYEGMLAAGEADGARDGLGKGERGAVA